MTTVLFVAAEDCDFDTTTSPGGFRADTGASSFRSNFVRCSVHPNNVDNLNPSYNRLRSDFWATQTTLWVHAWYYDFNYAGQNNNNLIALMDSGGVYRVILRSNGTLGQVKISLCNAAGTITDVALSGVYALLFGNIQAIDLSVTNYATAGTANISLYINGILAAAYTGTIQTDSCPGLCAVDFCGITNPYWSEMLVQDTDTRGRGIYAMAPVANGNTNTWTGNVSNVNQITENDANYNYVTTANQLAEYTTATTLPTGSWTIQTFWQTVRLNIGASGPQNFQFVTRTVDGSDHTAGTPTPINYFHNYKYQWTANPHTSAAWVASDFGAGFNYGIKSLT